MLWDGVIRLLEEEISGSGTGSGEGGGEGWARFFPLFPPAAPEDPDGREVVVQQDAAMSTQGDTLALHVQRSRSRPLEEADDQSNNDMKTVTTYAVTLSGALPPSAEARAALEAFQKRRRRSRARNGVSVHVNESDVDNADGDGDGDDSGGDGDALSALVASVTVLSQRLAALLQVAPVAPVFELTSSCRVGLDSPSEVLHRWLDAGALVGWEAGDDPDAFSDLSTCEVFSMAELLPPPSLPTPGAAPRWSGKWLVIEFWGAMCGPCQPAVSTLADVFSGSPFEADDDSGSDSSSSASSYSVPLPRSILEQTFAVALSVDKLQVTALRHTERTAWLSAAESKSSRFMLGWVGSQRMKAVLPTLLGVTATPTAVIVDPRGVLRWRGNPEAEDGGLRGLLLRMVGASDGGGGGEGGAATSAAVLPDPGGSAPEAASFAERPSPAVVVPTGEELAETARAMKALGVETGRFRVLDTVTVSLGGPSHGARTVSSHPSVYGTVRDGFSPHDVALRLAELVPGISASVQQD